MLAKCIQLKKNMFIFNTSTKYVSRNKVTKRFVKISYVNSSTLKKNTLNSGKISNDSISAGQKKMLKLVFLLDEMWLILSVTVFH
jgi:hypothetical protein